MHRLQDPGRDPRTPDGVAESSAAPGRGTVAAARFAAAWWCPGPHLQTLWPYLFRRTPRPRYRRERLELPDGDFVDLDWHGPAAAGAVVVILHGLEGSSASHYIRGLVGSLAGRGVTGVVMHQRGCSGEPNRLARFYHGGETTDFQCVLAHLRRARPYAGLYAVGYSLGGNILLKWLGESGNDTWLKAAVAVSVPFRLADGARRLERGCSRLYQSHLVASMKRSFEHKRASASTRRLIPPSVDPAAVARCRAFEQIDTCLTAPLHGFRDARDYYARSSCRGFLAAIRTPTLIVHARDDPFLIPAAIAAADELSPKVRLELSDSGGHCGFVAGAMPLKPRYWLDARIPRFLLERDL